MNNITSGNLRAQCPRESGGHCLTSPGGSRACDRDRIENQSNVHAGQDLRIGLDCLVMSALARKDRGHV